jgi:hypothetical protein
VGGESRREQRRWQRELEEQLRALPTYEGETPDGGEVRPVERRLPKPPRGRRARAAARRTPDAPVGPRAPGAERRRTFVTVGLTLAVIVAVFGASLSPLAESLRGVLGLQGDRGESTEYEFLEDDSFGGPLRRWSSCDPIRYVVNPGRAPDGWEDNLSSAISSVSEASGLRFVSEGTSTDGPEASRFSGNRPEPVLVSWVSPEELPSLEGDTVGVAGPSSLGDTYVTGTVILDGPAFADMEQRGDEGLQRAVLMHELAHLVGLDHVEDERQLMYPSTTFQTTFGNGDLEGLRILGEGPC